MKISSDDQIKMIGVKGDLYDYDNGKTHDKMQIAINAFGECNGAPQNTNYEFSSHEKNLMMIGAALLHKLNHDPEFLKENFNPRPNG